MRAPLFFVGAFLIGHVAQAALVWEKSALELSAEQGQAAATAVFKFTNKGDKAVKITSVSTSCGCTVAKPAKDTYAAGESGELPAKLSIGESSMTRHISIRVETDETTANAYDLSLTAQVAELIAVSQRLVLWKIGAEPDARRIEVKVRPGITVTAAAVDGDGFTARLEKSEQGEPVISVSPTATGARRLATLRITAKRETGEELSAKVFLRVAAP